MEEKTPTILAIEGTDGCGKDFTSRALMDEIVTSDHNINPIYTSFPSYWYPQGTLIRMMNRGLAEEYSKNNGLSFEEELNLRSSMFALDRAMIELVVLGYCKKEMNNIQISDRLFMSNVNTLSYLVTREQDTETAKKLFSQLLPTAIEADSDLKNSTNNIHAILNPKDVSISFSTLRPELDQLEKPTARDFANWGYSQIPQIFPDIHSFIIQNQDQNGNWLDINTIVQEIIEKSNIDISKSHKNDSDDEKNKQSERIHFPNPISFLRTFYPEGELQLIPESTLKDYVLNTRRLLIFSGMGDTSPDRKKILDDIETNIASSLESTMSYITLDKKFLQDSFCDKWPLKQINRLLTTHTNGNLFPFIQFLCEKNNYSIGHLRLIEALGEIS